MTPIIYRKTNKVSDLEERERSHILIKYVHMLEDRLTKDGFVRHPRQLAYESTDTTIRMTEIWKHPKKDEKTQEENALFIVKELIKGKQILTDAFLLTNTELCELTRALDQFEVKEK